MFSLPPVVTFNSVITTLDLMPAILSPTITGNTDEITSVIFALLDDDAEFPPGAIASLTDDDPMDNQDPGTSLTTNMAGTYKVKVEIQSSLYRKATSVADNSRSVCKTQRPSYLASSRTLSSSISKCSFAFGVLKYLRYRTEKIMLFNHVNGKCQL